MEIESTVVLTRTNEFPGVNAVKSTLVRSHVWHLQSLSLVHIFGWLDTDQTSEKVW